MKNITLFAFLFSFALLTAQSSDNVPRYLVGSWEGAFIKSNSYQKLDIDFSERDGKVFALQIMEEWHPTFGEFEVPVAIDSIGNISLGTGYGKATLKLDKNNLELVGQLSGFNPAMYVHLKKTASKPKPSYSLEEVSISSSEVTLFGHLHKPMTNDQKTAIIMVGGRGCYPDQTKYNLYAKLLRQYGVSVLAYQKRGTGSSTGDCSLATIEDLADDVISAKRFLETHLNGYEKIGVIGISAGGWTMNKALSKTNFDFMISIVGPSTSVRAQQFQSMGYGLDVYQLSEIARKNVMAYTTLMYMAKSNQKNYDKMMNLLKNSEEEGWKQLLDDSDIPSSVEGIDLLWVRRHKFDPKKALQKYNGPYLAIYGDRDWIVPQKTNIALLKEYFSDKPDKLTTVLAYNAEHGMEMESRQVDLGGNQSYWHFYRVSPQVRIEIIDFLRKHKFIN